MSTRVPPYPIFDADNHLYETQDAFTKYLPEEFKGAIRYVEVDGRTKIAVRGHISEYIPNPTFEVVARPGAQEDYFRIGNPEGKSYREIIGKPMRSIPAFREPKSRLELMDEQGIERTLMFPTLASLLEERMSDDPELTHIVIHALNEWLYETWQFNYENRIFTTPVITLPIVEKAIEELEWVVERGAKAILIRPAPVPGFSGSRSFGLPEFDPFWEKVVEHDLLVTLHSSDSGYSRYTDDWESNKREFLPFQPDVFRMIGQWRPIEDSVAALICHGALSRFPTLKIAVVENGASWVGPLIKTLKDVYKKYPQQFAEEPVSVLRRNVHISPFWEENMADLAELLGVERVLFGSDFPHPEGLGDPASFVDELKNLTDEEKALIMGGNLARLISG
ncbi:amidohydrolase [Frankia sp. Mgl5]|uniref:amidohydrolase family protein n=1 Tax=Frankiaceae TaxID=74712 RepID=UPI000DA47E3F|nr:MULTISPECIES: amidohydrolase family protein [Frankiaceae]MCK9929074.1 amidohydrolase [Frankia sp. Mgl5]TCJ34747.1 amidohydrolase [Parafrankia sp. BMG5.11]SQD95403.1 Amidohydrolase 2 [Parafrankia sp. Ea1.12]